MLLQHTANDPTEKGQTAPWPTEALRFLLALKCIHALIRPVNQHII